MHRLSGHSRQIDFHNPDWFVIASVLEEAQERATGHTFNELCRKKFRAELRFLRRALILEVEKDRVHCVTVDAGHIPGDIDVGRVIFGRDKAPTNEHA
jgi:hypothetical protein